MFDADHHVHGDRFSLLRPPAASSLFAEDCCVNWEGGVEMPFQKCHFETYGLIGFAAIACFAIDTSSRPDCCFPACHRSCLPGGVLADASQ